jgi:diaminohydroxyphosphoribosylaminopyrimidine deaminase/5-amino-6-(5-phosphoribosylamino)uracil reductase
MTLDGRSAAADGSSQWITGQPTRQRVHFDRSQHDAIIVGINTVLLDNPQLTARKPDGSLYSHQPHAVVMGQRNLPPDSSLPSHPGGFTHIRKHDVKDALIQLYQAGMRSVYVEGGPTLASAFLRDRLTDELHITMGPLLLGGPHTALSNIGVETMAEAHHLSIVDVHRLGDDLVVIAQPQKEGSH